MTKTEIIFQFTSLFEKTFKRAFPKAQWVEADEGRLTLILDDNVDDPTFEWLAAACKNRQSPTVSLIRTAHREKPNPKSPEKMAIAGVRHTIAVVSAKGGVGKSTTALMLAYALQRARARVGIVDADVYGPSLPYLLDHWTGPEVDDQKRLIPIQKNNLASLSLGYMIATKQGVLWRGPMIQSAVTQMLFGADWRGLDYLIIDTPPGTGDIHMTLAQRTQLSGAIVVTTPDPLALQDVRRGVQAYQQLDVPLLGYVLNMATYHCGQCHHEGPLFWKGLEGFDLDLPVLASLPFDSALQMKLGRAGVPDAQTFTPYEALAHRVIGLLG